MTCRQAAASDPERNGQAEKWRQLEAENERLREMVASAEQLEALATEREWYVTKRFIAGRTSPGTHHVTIYRRVASTRQWTPIGEAFGDTEAGTVREATEMAERRWAELGGAASSSERGE